MSYMEEPAPAGQASTCNLLHQVPTEAVPLAGHHNRNFVHRAPADLGKRKGWPFPTPAVKYRVPIPNSREFDLFPWGDEGDLLDRLNSLGHWPRFIPEVLARSACHVIHSFAEGVSLGSLSRPEAPVPPTQLGQIVKLFGLMARTPGDVLPCSPEGWPETGDSPGFFRQHLRFARDVFYRTPPDCRLILHGLGVRGGETFVRLEKRGVELRSRPFALLHGDLHRDNIVVGPSDRLFFIDWELAMYGDPVYDLATHLRLMRYPADQEAEVIAGWYEELFAVEPSGSLVAGMTPQGGDDLDTYLDFKRVQAVHTDTARASLSLKQGVVTPESVAPRLARVLSDARVPLGLKSGPSLDRVVSLLHDWLRAERLK